jgi:phage shock protein C
MGFTGNGDRRFYRSNNDRVLAGVCGGIAEHFDLSPWGVRLVWVLLTFIGMPFTVIAYIILVFVLKRRPQEFGDRSPATADWTAGAASHGQMLGRLQERFATLDKRLQRMETVVTRPTYGLEQEYRNLR